jgi:hypothetical protein
MLSRSALSSPLSRLLQIPPKGAIGNGKEEYRRKEDILVKITEQNE